MSTHIKKYSTLSYKVNTTYNHFLDKDSKGKVLGEFAQEIQTVEGDQKFKNNLISHELCPPNINVPI